MIATILSDQWRLLSFRNPGPEIRTHWRAYLAFGLLCTWLAGIGRYWDNPKAYWWQHLGLGSVVYVFVLALLLYLLLAYQIVFAISVYSILAAPVLIIAYAWLAIRAWRRSRNQVFIP